MHTITTTALLLPALLCCFHAEQLPDLIPWSNDSPEGEANGQMPILRELALYPASEGGAGTVLDATYPEQEGSLYPQTESPSDDDATTIAATDTTTTVTATATTTQTATATSTSTSTSTITSTSTDTATATATSSSTTTDTSSTTTTTQTATTTTETTSTTSSVTTTTTTTDTSSTTATPTSTATTSTSSTTTTTAAATTEDLYPEEEWESDWALQLSLTLQVELAQFDVTNFVTSLASSLSVPASDVIVLSIRSGSVVVEVALKASTEEVQTLQQRVAVLVQEKALDVGYDMSWEMVQLILPPSELDTYPEEMMDSHPPSTPTTSTTTSTTTLVSSTSGSSPSTTTSSSSTASQEVSLVESPASQAPTNAALWAVPLSIVLLLLALCLLRRHRRKGQKLFPMPVDLEAGRAPDCCKKSDVLETQVPQADNANNGSGVDVDKPPEVSQATVSNSTTPPVAQPSLISSTSESVDHGSASATEEGQTQLSGITAGPPELPPLPAMLSKPSKPLAPLRDAPAPPVIPPSTEKTEMGEQQNTLVSEDKSSLAEQDSSKGPAASNNLLDGEVAHGQRNKLPPLAKP